MMLHKAHGIIFKNDQEARLLIQNYHYDGNGMPTNDAIPTFCTSRSANSTDASSGVVK